jgi:glycosyltransferase involved in cell wall biosynthesis
LFNKTKHLWHNSHAPFPWSQAKLYHFFNTISYGKTPWITTFESTLPRWGNQSNSKKALQLMAGNSCKQLIAMSKSASLMQRDFLENAHSDLAQSIYSKIIVKLPPQQTLIESMDEKFWPQKLTFTLIGADFFRKGGAEVLQVLTEFWDRGAAIHLNLISSLDFGDYATKTTYEDQIKVIKTIEQYQNHITHHHRLPNPQVLELLKHSHVGLLPTYAETFGYSVLEAQAAGCPVITTNIRALPEINDAQKGWVIEVPKLKNGNGKLQTAEDRAVFSDVIKTGLRSIFSELLSNQLIAQQKGTASLAHISTNHSPEKHSLFLAEIYTRALKKN